MKTRHEPLIALATLATILGGTAVAQDAHSDAVVETQDAATFVGTDGSEIGGANIVDVPIGGVLISIQIEGLQGDHWHAFHIHEGGECNPEDAFESAGGHYNPDDAQHGYLVEGGAHAGDMPNQFVPENGILRARVHNPNVSLDGEEPSIRGRTLMIHSDPDDYTSQPSGDAGDRLACAVIP